MKMGARTYRIVRGMFAVCLLYARDMFAVCSRHVRAIFALCRRNVVIRRDPGLIENFGRE